MTDIKVDLLQQFVKLLIKSLSGSSVKGKIMLNQEPLHLSITITTTFQKIF